MGQKVNPHGIRVGMTKEWDSVWYAEPSYCDFVREFEDYPSLCRKKMKNWISQVQNNRVFDFLVRKLKYFRRKC